MLIHYDTLLYTMIHVNTNQALIFIFTELKIQKMDIYLTDGMEFLICES